MCILHHHSTWFLCRRWKRGRRESGLRAGLAKGCGDRAAFSALLALPCSLWEATPLIRGLVVVKIGGRACNIDARGVESEKRVILLH